jgi:hypothetical protein
MQYKKIASALMCFNRPDYTRHTIKSLVANTEVNDVDWFIFQDGIVNEISSAIYSEEEPHKRVEKVIRNSGLPITNYVKQEFNISPYQQRYQILRLLKEYDLIYVFDDDMIVSPHYLRLLRIMAEQFPNYIGIMNRHRNRGKKLRFLQVCGHARLWGHYMNKQTYNLIEEKFTRYYNHVKKFDFHKRRTYPDMRTAEVPYVLDDVAINKLCQMYGIKKLWPFVTRGRYIGKKGTVAYKTAGYWKKKGMDRQPEEITYPGDAKLKSFRLG